jgi:hypothetical protein
MNKPAALYSRVSSDRQKENHTIASQVAALTRCRLGMSGSLSINQSVSSQSHFRLPPGLPGRRPNRCTPFPRKSCVCRQGPARI